MTIEQSASTARLDLHPKKPDDPKALHDGAQQFEAFLIAQMLRSVRESAGSEQSTGSDSASTTALGMADDAFAKALSQRGGLGLGRLVEADVAHAGAAPKHPVKASATD
jgi:Rod binding domain-containing protein